MPRDKIDDDGNYLPFPGYTVIFKTSPDSSGTWRNIHNELLNKLPSLAKYYSILPFESWHVTAINLFTKTAVEDDNLDWSKYVASQQRFFSQLSDVIKQDLFTPVITYSGLRVDGSVHIMVSLDETSKEKVEALAKYYGYQHNLPRHFHMTLGYQYKHLKNKELDALKLELAPFIQDCFRNMSVALEPAQVCYFDDMTAFVPWDENKERILRPKYSIFEPRIDSDEPKNKGESSSSHDSNAPKI